MFILINFQNIALLKLEIIKVCHNRIFQTPHFVWQIFRSPEIAQKWFVFKISIWISVSRRRKQFVNPFFGYRDISQTRWLIYYYTPCKIVYVPTFIGGVDSIFCPSHAFGLMTWIKLNKKLFIAWGSRQR